MARLKVHDPEEESLPDMLKRLADDLGSMVRQDIEAARAEMVEKAKAAGLGAGMLSGSAIAAVFALFSLTVLAIVGLSAVELTLVVLTIVLVISMEMMNTVIEEVVNLVTKDYREEAKIAKDVAAGMVLVSAMGAIMVVLLLYLPHLLYLFR